MKNPVIIAITLFVLSAGAFADDAEQQAAEESVSETEPCISFSMIKEAFKLGFQSGWMVEK